MEFCKAFNAQTQKMEPGLPVPVVITAYQDKSFTFVMKTPPASVLISKAAKIEKGSSRPNTDKVGQDHARPGRGNCQDENARSHGGGPRCGGAHHCRQRAQHGRRRGGPVNGFQTL